MNNFFKTLTLFCGLSFISAWTQAQSTNLSFENSIIIDCPSDIQKMVTPEQQQIAISWDEPTNRTTCSQIIGIDCFHQEKDGFDFLGTYNGNHYYLSQFSAPYEHAWAISLESGGTLAAICNAAENDFLKEQMTTATAWIGYSDAQTEGTFSWASAIDCNYTNWAENEPNNHDEESNAENADFVILQKSDGKWSDKNSTIRHAFIMKIPCPNKTELGAVTMTQIEGPSSGSLFPIGETSIKYEAKDNCDNSQFCTFKIIIKPTPISCDAYTPGVEMLTKHPNCGQNDGRIQFGFKAKAFGSKVEFSLDGGQTYPLSVADDQNFAEFTDLPVGDYDLFMRWHYGECSQTLGTVTLTGSELTPGASCDDNNATTTNDIILDDGCTCQGNSEDLVIVCANNLEVIAGEGEEGIVVTFDDPMAETDCPNQFFDELLYRRALLVYEIEKAQGGEVTPPKKEDYMHGFTQTEVLSSLKSGDVFPIGTTDVVFQVTDACDNIAKCILKVTVLPHFTNELIVTCPADISIQAAAAGDTGIVVTFDEPMATTNCPESFYDLTAYNEARLKFTRVGGVRPKKEDFLLGTIQTEVLSDLKSGDVFPLGTTKVLFLVKDACGEEKRCTIRVSVNPSMDFDCEDIVVTTNEEQINITGLNGPWVVVKIHDKHNGWGIIEDCYGCTADQSYQIPAGNYRIVVEYYNQPWQDKVCKKEIEVTIESKDKSNLDCNNISTQVENGRIKINGLTAPNEIVKIFTDRWAVLENGCFGDCGDSFEVPATGGNYVVRVSFYSASWEAACEVDIPVIVPSTADIENGKRAIEGMTTTRNSALKVYPNPVQETLFVDLAQFAGKNGFLQITNLFGQTVETIHLHTIATAPTPLNLSNYTNGIYLLKLKIENGSYLSKKFFVSRMY